MSQKNIRERACTGFDKNPNGRRATKQEAATIARIISHALTSKGANIAQFTILKSSGAYQFAAMTFRFPRRPVASRRKPL